MKFTIVIFFILWSNLGLAEEMSLKQATKALLTSLIDSKIESVGTLDLQKLLLQVETVEYRQFTGKFPSFTKNRRSAFYKKGVVYSRGRFPKILGDSVKLLGLHETLGALGFNDENYRLSSALYYLSKSPDPEQLINTYEMQATFSEDSMLFSGGVTSIGGGGDLIAARYKAKMLKLLYQLSHSTSDALEILQVAIEPAATSHLRIGYLPDLDLESALYYKHSKLNFQRTGRTSPLYSNLLLEVPASYASKVTKDLSELVKSMAGKNSTVVSTCGPFHFLLNKGVLKIVKKTGELSNLKASFYQHCQRALDEIK